MNPVLISVVTVCFNAESTIRRTMESVLGQTYQPLEYILIDGKSTDRTLDIIREMKPLFEGKGVKFYWLSEPDKGIYDAMNKGIGLACGEWINFMNAGDSFCDENAISRLFAADIRADAKVVYGDYLRQKSYAIIPTPGNPPEKTPQIMPACHQAMFARVDEMKAHPFDTSFRLVADYHFIYNLYMRGGKMQYVPVNVALFEAVEGATSVHKLAVWRECARVQGIEHTFRWRWKYARKAASFCWKRSFESLIPASLLVKLKRKNRERLERRHQPEEPSPARPPK